MMDHLSAVSQMVKSAEDHAKVGAEARQRAIEYYKGEMKDTPSDDGRSSMTTRVVRSQIKKVLPSIIRTILHGDEIVEFRPQGPGDEEVAEQASDYVNFVVIPESNGKQAIHDAIFDALQVRNGVLRAQYEMKRDVQFSDHTGLPGDAFAQLVSDEDVTVLAHSERVERVDTPQGGAIDVPVHDVQIRRLVEGGCVRITAVPQDRFLISPDAISIEDSTLVGERQELTRSDLVRMGMDKDLVWSLPVAGDEYEDRDARRDDAEDRDEPSRANELIAFYDVFARIDMDEDGISELRHMQFAGGFSEDNLVLNEPAAEAGYYDLVAQREPHQREGVSLSDDLMDLQRAQTVLLRQTLDNIYWANNPQPAVDMSALADPDSLLNPEFGKVVQLKQGHKPQDSVSYLTVPFVANHSFGMMEYLDTEAQQRTGISDASSGMAPDALQNMTAKASSMMEAAGIGQTEMMVRCLADGLQRFFRGVLGILVRHQDVPRTVRLRDEWVTVDPRDWNAGMDATVNVGLGAGTRERDMIVMQQVMAVQEKLLAAFGPDNPFVKPENLWNTLSRLVEASGLTTASLYFTEPDPQEIAAKMAAQSQQPDAETMRAQAEIQVQQERARAQIAIEQQKMQAATQKERAQMEADLTVEREKLAAGALLKDKEIAWEREKLAKEQAFELEQGSRRVAGAMI